MTSQLTFARNSIHDITGIVTRVTRRAPHVEQELPILP